MPERRDQHHAEQIRIMSEVSRQIASLLEIEDILFQVVRLIQAAFGYYHVAIALIEGDQAVYKVGAGKLWDDPAFQFKPGSLTVGKEGITGHVAGTGEAYLARDVSKDPYYVCMDSSMARSELTVPIKVKGTILGVLDVQSTELDAFEASDLVMVQALADQAAVAVENAQLYQQARQIAVLEERQRLARELHDSVTQALYAVTLYAEAAARQLASSQPAIAIQHLTLVEETAQEALREMRLLIYELRPSILEEQGLAEAIRSRLEAVEERAGLKTSNQIRIRGDIPEQVEECLYRIAHEALNNSLKHAGASKVRVQLCYDEDGGLLEVTDDGVGFDPTDESHIGLGLPGMRERADMIGGTLTIDSERGIGTTIRLVMPAGSERKPL